MVAACRHSSGSWSRRGSLRHSARRPERLWSTTTGWLGVRGRRQQERVGSRVRLADPRGLPRSVGAPDSRRHSPEPGQAVPLRSSSSAASNWGGGSSWRVGIDGLANSIKLRHYSPKTLGTYTAWVRRFQAFTGRAKWDLPAEERKKKLAYLARCVALAKQLGIDKLHFSVHTYHHQPNFPGFAARIGITGERVRNAVSPRRAEGREWRIYCKTHAESRDAMLENVKAAIDHGAAVIHLEVFFRGETQCVCDRCAERLREALRSDPRVARFREPSRKMGTGDASRFHIRHYLLDRTDGDERERRCRPFSIFCHGVVHVVDLTTHCPPFSRADRRGGSPHVVHRGTQG